MAQVLSSFAYKGGVGKTTLLILLSYWTARKGARILVLDSDRGGSLRSWGKRRSALGKDLPFLIEKSGNFDFNSKKLKGDDQQEWDFVFMDCPPTIDDLAILRLKKSDFLIVPLCVGGFDFDRLDIMAGEQEFGKIPKVIVLNKVSYHAEEWASKSIFDNGKTLLAILEEYCQKLNCNYLILGDRKEYRDISLGITPWDQMKIFRLLSTNFFAEFRKLLKAVREIGLDLPPPD